MWQLIILCFCFVTCWRNLPNFASKFVGWAPPLECWVRQPMMQSHQDDLRPLSPFGWSRDCRGEISFSQNATFVLHTPEFNRIGIYKHTNLSFLFKPSSGFNQIFSESGIPIVISQKAFTLKKMGSWTICKLFFLHLRINSITPVELPGFQYSQDL